MRYILVMYLMFLSLISNGKTFYTSPSGANSNSGTKSNPWLSFSYACSQVKTIGDTIFVITGNYYELNRCNPAEGVYLTGEGEGSHIVFSYNSGNTSDAVIYFYSALEGAKGNQSISNLWLDGNNLTAFRAIYIRHRSNVEVKNCKITNFRDLCCHFSNQIGWLTPPVIFATGNSFHDNKVINCSSMNSEQGHIRFDGQSGFECINNYFDQTQRPLGENGHIVKWSFVKKSKIIANKFKKNDIEGSAWNFFMELWNGLGDNEILNNEFYGRACIDVGGYTNSIANDCTFEAKIQGNKFLNSNLAVHPYHESYAINIEGGGHSYIYVNNNLIQRFGLPIAMEMEYYSSFAQNMIMHHIYIFDNNLENCGYSDYQYNYGISLKCEDNLPAPYYYKTDNIHILNNKISGGSGFNYRGVSITLIGSATNYRINNNEISEFDTYPVYITKQANASASINGMEVNYNYFLHNGSDKVYLNPYISLLNYDITTGNETELPELNGLIYLEDELVESENSLIER